MRTRSGEAAPAGRVPQVSAEVAEPPVGRPLPWLLRRVNQRYRDDVVQALHDAGFTDVPRAGYWTLMAVADGASDAKDLMAATGVSKQAVSKTVESLVAGGYLERHPHGADRRRIDLRLSRKGRRAVHAIETAVRRTDGLFAAELGTDAQCRLHEMLDRLAHLPPGNVP